MAQALFSLEVLEMGTLEYGTSGSLNLFTNRKTKSVSVSDHSTSAAIAREGANSSNNLRFPVPACPCLALKWELETDPMG